MNKKLTIHKDERGELAEIFKIPNVGQVHYSTSVPGTVRGNHYHTRKREYFCVIEGQGKIRLRDRDSGKIKEHIVTGQELEVVEMPINWTHSIENIGENEMKLIVWTNEVFNPNDPDTFKEEV